MTFYRENSAVLQTIRACLPKVNGWENPSVRLLLIAGTKPSGRNAAKHTATLI